MHLALAPLEPKDFPRAFEVLSLGFGNHNVFFNAFNPAHSTPEGRAVGAARLRQAAEDPRKTYLKVVDIDAKTSGYPGGLIVSVGCWTFYDGDTSPGLDPFAGTDWWADGKGDRAYVKELFKRMWKLRGQAVSESKGHIYGLDVLATDPKYERKGAGSMIMKWGVDRGYKLGLGGFTEATAAGLGLYEKFGFQARFPVELHVPEPWADLPREKYTWIERPRSDGQLWDGRKFLTPGGQKPDDPDL